MNVSLAELEAAAQRCLTHAQVANPQAAAWACAWLQACGYPGVKLLLEAVADTERHVPLERDALGYNLNNVSCVFLVPALVDDVVTNGRVFLRNVRHGLYLVPFAVVSNMAIGCPVDPAFALGGARSKNPYDEKLALAATSGVEVEDALWAQLAES